MIFENPREGKRRFPLSSLHSDKDERVTCKRIFSKGEYQIVELAPISCEKGSKNRSDTHTKKSLATVKVHYLSNISHRTSMVDKQVISDSLITYQKYAQ